MSEPTHVDLWDLYAQYCRELNPSLPESWAVYAAEVKESPYGDFLELTGAVAPLITKGKNKGRRNWPQKDKKTVATVQIKFEGFNEFKEWWSEVNGICWQCSNTGQQFTGWSLTGGNSYKPCTRCSCGGGQAQKVQLSLLEALP